MSKPRVSGTISRNTSTMRLHTAHFFDPYSADDLGRAVQGQSGGKVLARDQVPVSLDGVLFSESAGVRGLPTSLYGLKAETKFAHYLHYLTDEIVIRWGDGVSSSPKHGPG